MWLFIFGNGGLRRCCAKHEEDHQDQRSEAHFDFLDFDFFIRIQNTVPRLKKREPRLPLSWKFPINFPKKFPQEISWESLFLHTTSNKQLSQS
jgi:hypothetical protein